MKDKPNTDITMTELSSMLQNLENKAREQADRQTPGSYNEGHLEGEIQGYQKLRKKLKERREYVEKHYSR